MDLYSSCVDLRIGIQKFAWGRLDEINPTDNLNPEDFRHGITADEIDRKIGVPALRANTYSDIVNVELAWIPWFVPYRLPTPEERWFPGVLQPPSSIDTGTSAGPDAAGSSSVSPVRPCANLPRLPYDGQ